MAWDNDLAGLFKARENPVKIGAVTGTVLTPLPNLTISILDGKVVLQPDQLYITAGLKEKLFKTEIRGHKSGDIKLRGITYSVNTETLGEDGFPNSRTKIIESTDEEKLFEITNLDIFTKDNVKIKQWYELKPGDEVLVIPSTSEQEFFVVDLIEKVGG